MKKVNYCLLIALPLLLFYLGMFLHVEVGFYHLYTVEPSYGYLLDGLNICSFAFPSNVINPGTPLAVLYAVVMGIVHLFRQQDTLIIDVMKNPEIYLSAVYITLITIESVLLFVVGFIISKVSKSIITGLFFQLTPFVSWIIIDIMRPMLAEDFVVVGMLVLIILVYNYILYQDNETKLFDKYLLGFSLVTGFIAASKLQNLPIAIIPFLLLPGYKKKGLYIFLSIIAFAVFACPIFNDWVTFRDYYINNFTHSGIYGAGSNTIVDLNTFIPNFKNIFSYDHLYLKSFSIIVIGSILYYLPFLNVKRDNDKTYKALLGIAISMIITTLLVAKQFKFYYMTSALILSIPGLYFVYSIYTRNISKLIRLIIVVPLGGFLLYHIYNEINYRISWHPGMMTRQENLLNTKKFIDDTYSKNQPTLLIADYYGAPYIEYGCFYGMAWCKGEIKNKYSNELKKLYPNSYFYHSWNNLFNQWDKSYSFIYLLKKYQNIVLFSGDSEVERTISTKLHGINRQVDTKFKIVKSFDKTRETIYEVSYDSILWKKHQQFYFNAEQLDSSKQYFINNEGLKVENGITQSSDFAKSGKYSCKLTKDRPYGFTSVISEVSEGEHYIISVWRYNNGNSNTGLVVAANDINKYYLFQTQPQKQEKQWEKIEIDFVVPESAINHDVKVYVWNNDSNLPAYFDDFIIEKIK